MQLLRLKMLNRLRHNQLWLNHREVLMRLLGPAVVNKVHLVQPVLLALMVNQVHPARMEHLERLVLTLIYMIRCCLFRNNVHVKQVMDLGDHLDHQEIRVLMERMVHWVAMD